MSPGISPILSAVLTALGIVAVWGAWVLWRRLRAKMLGREPTPPGRVCTCGYALEGIELPRCPECGRAIGFDKTFEELGVDVRDVERHVRAKRGTTKS